MLSLPCMHSLQTQAASGLIIREWQLSQTVSLGWLKIERAYLPSLPASLAAIYLHNIIGPGPPLREGGSNGAGKKDVFFSPKLPGMV